VKTDAAENRAGQVPLDELLQENARMRGDLLTIAHRISHDLRTPLGGINVTSEMLKEMLADGSPIPGSTVNPIFDSTDEIIKLIERVGFVLKASVKPAPKEPVKMGHIVFEVLQKLERKILQKNATVSQPNSWPEVNGVALWLGVIWWNLLSNPLRLAKNPLKMDLGWRDEKGEIQFWVSDDAGGVPSEIRGKLFQPFESLHESDAAPGLGLAIVHRLVSLQGGRCGYVPNSESGSLFYFTLPTKAVGRDHSPKKPSTGKIR
jgi:signal transduction histidine kinase